MLVQPHFLMIKRIEVKADEDCVLNVRSCTCLIDRVFLSCSEDGLLTMGFESPTLDKGDERITLSLLYVARHLYREILDSATSLEKLYLMSSYRNSLERMSEQGLHLKGVVRSSYLSENMIGSFLIFTRNEKFIFTLSTSAVTYSVTLSRQVCKAILKFSIENYQDSTL